MARIRTIKPDFWTDESLTECSLSARLMFIGMFNFADDNGNLARSAKKLKMQIFPGDSIDCEPLIQELITHGMLMDYSVNGEKFLNIKGFRKHQVINRPSASLIPEPQNTEDSQTTHGGLTEDSQREGKGREGNGREDKNNTLSGIAKSNQGEPDPVFAKPQASPSTTLAEPARRPVNGCRLPTDFLPDAEPALEADMAKLGVVMADELPRFCDHWRQASGKSAVKRDWQAAWRTWCRNSVDFAVERMGRHRGGLQARPSPNSPPESAYQRGLREAGSVLAPSVGRHYQPPVNARPASIVNAIETHISEP